MKTTTLTGECTCENGHLDQIEKYPVGTYVRSTFYIDNPPPHHGMNMPVGALGQVRDHCNDGRANVSFFGYRGGHTFHFPEDSLEIVPKEKGDSESRAIEQRRVDASRRPFIKHALTTAKEDAAAAKARVSKLQAELNSLTDV